MIRLRSSRPKRYRSLMAVSIYCSNRMPSGGMVSLGGYGLAFGPHYGVIRRYRALAQSTQGFSLFLSGLPALAGSASNASPPALKGIKTLISKGRWMELGDCIEKAMEEAQGDPFRMSQVIRRLRMAGSEHTVELRAFFASRNEGIDADEELETKAKVAMILPHHLETVIAEVKVYSMDVKALMTQIENHGIVKGLTAEKTRKIRRHIGALLCERIDRKAYPRPLVLHARDKVSYTGLLSGITTNESMELMLAAEGLVVATPGPVSQLTRLAKKSKNSSYRKAAYKLLNLPGEGSDIGLCWSPQPRWMQRRPLPWLRALPPCPPRPRWKPP